MISACQAMHYCHKTITNYSVVVTPLSEYNFCNTEEYEQYITWFLYGAGRALQRNALVIRPESCLTRIYQMACCQEKSKRTH